MEAVKVDSLKKNFGDFTAVNNISFSIKEGEIFGLLGPNGAGKTTTLSMLATLLEPTSGAAFVNQFSIKTEKDNVRKSIGIVFQDPSLDDELTAYENMDFHGRLYHVPKEIRKNKSIELLKLVGLEERKNDLVKTFSGGMKRRLEIARGLLHEPKVLFLDEPTLGLDPQTRNKLWDYIEMLNKEKRLTIILTTHYMEEADKLCNRIAIMDNGVIVVLDTPAKLKDMLGGDIVTIESPENAKLETAIKHFSWFKSAKKHNGSLTINVQNADKHVGIIAKTACDKNIEIKSLNIHKPTLEDVFLHFTGRTIREQETDSKEHMRLRARMWRRR